MFKRNVQNVDNVERQPEHFNKLAMKEVMHPAPASKCSILPRQANDAEQ
jgi:hypothetical protein